MIIPQPNRLFFKEWRLSDCRAAQSKKTPAPHQREALVRLHRWYAGISGGQSGGILVLPTGGGKTFTAVHFLCTGPLSDGYKVLWLAHTHHLLEQAFESFSPGLLGHIREPRHGLQLRVVSGTIGHFRPFEIDNTDDVVIATLQTITGAYAENHPSLRAFLRSAKGKLVVVFDEAHHSPAPSYRRLVQGLRDEGASLLGLTATPTYNDEHRKGWLKKLFPQGILAQKRAGELIAAEILARPHFEKVKTQIVPTFDDREYKRWLGTYRDIPESIIEQLAKNVKRNAFIAHTYTTNRKRYGKTLIFTDRWFQCEAIVEALDKLGVKAGAVYSHVDASPGTVAARRTRGAEENSRVLERFRKGEIDVLVNVRMLTEGTDVPDAQTVFLTRQTTSRILLTQMVGRVLRGPKFGGTADAYIVSFTDDWQQSIQWAEYDALEEGLADDSAPAAANRPPLQLISIDLLRRLVCQMDTEAAVEPVAFLSNMPVGWYRTTFDAREPDSDDVLSQDKLVMVFEDERRGFDNVIAELRSGDSLAYEDESLAFESRREVLDRLRAKHFQGVRRLPSDLLFDVFNVARHIGQGNGAPVFFPFDARTDHDLDAVARDFIERNLGPREIHKALWAEFGRGDRYWSVLFHRFEQFRGAHHECQRRLLDGDGPEMPGPLPIRTEIPAFTEPDESLKEQVKRRDGHRCLACGATKHLQVDHVIPVHLGGLTDIGNLQTLCRECNLRKGTVPMRFTGGVASPSSEPPASARQDSGENRRSQVSAKGQAQFMKPVQADAVLGAVVGTEPMPRTEVTRRLWDYIKKLGLQHPDDKRTIVSDAKLRVLFDGKSQISMFELARFVNQHLR
jgi:superfamily II DNA or RNA helicase